MTQEIPIADIPRPAQPHPLVKLYAKAKAEFGADKASQIVRRVWRRKYAHEKEQAHAEGN